MGTYTELTIAGYPIISSKSAVIPELMTVFRESDRQMFTRKLSERNALVWGKPEESEGDEVETAIEYACETTKVIDRLNVMGFTLRRAQDEFDTFRRAKLGQYEEWAEDGGDAQWLADSTSMLEYLRFEVLKFPVFYYATRSITMPMSGFRGALPGISQSIPKPRAVAS